MHDDGTDDAFRETEGREFLIRTEASQYETNDRTIFHGDDQPFRVKVGLGKDENFECVVRETFCGTSP